MCFTLTRSRFRCAFFLHRHHPHSTLGGRSSPTSRRALWVAWCSLDWDSMHKPLTSSHVRCYVTRPLFTLPTFDLRLELSRWPVPQRYIFSCTESKKWTQDMDSGRCGLRQTSDQPTNLRGCKKRARADSFSMHAATKTLGATYVFCHIHYPDKKNM